MSIGVKVLCCGLLSNVSLLLQVSILVALSIGLCAQLHRGLLTRLLLSLEVSEIAPPQLLLDLLRQCCQRDGLGSCTAAIYQCFCSRWRSRR